MPKNLLYIKWYILGMDAYFAEFFTFSISTRRLQSTFTVFIDPDALVAEICNFKDSTFLQKLNMPKTLLHIKWYMLGMDANYAIFFTFSISTRRLQSRLLPFLSIQMPYLPRYVFSKIRHFLKKTEYAKNSALYKMAYLKHG